MLSGCFFLLAILFFIVGLVRLFEPLPEAAGGLPDHLNYPPPGTQPAQAPAGAPSFSGLNRAQVIGAGDSAGAFGSIRVGERIRLHHPTQGELTLYVMGQVMFDELWQKEAGGRPGPQTPWTPTGNAFSGFWLETNLLLLNWQNRYYVLDEVAYLSDAEIQRDFAPHARKFAQSDQTGDVYFAYPPATWHIDDIGKFRVRSVTGEGLRLSPGAIGRFVHASGDSRRALVLEDYESGGQDAVWTGFLLNAEDIG